MPGQTRGPTDHGMNDPAGGTSRVSASKTLRGDVRVGGPLGGMIQRVGRKARGSGPQAAGEVWMACRFSVMRERGGIGGCCGAWVESGRTSLAEASRGM